MFRFFGKEDLGQPGHLKRDVAALPAEEHGEEALGAGFPVGVNREAEEAGAIREEAKGEAREQSVTAVESGRQGRRSDDQALCGDQEQQQGSHAAEVDKAVVDRVKGPPVAGCLTAPDGQEQYGEQAAVLTQDDHAVAEADEILLPEVATAIPIPPTVARRQRKRKGRRLEPSNRRGTRQTFSPQQRLLLLDTWRRSGLPAKDFSGLVGVSQGTLYKWKQQFDEHGPEGLMDRARTKRRSSRLPELTKRTIVMVKENHPEWGCQRISDMLLRGPALPASPSAVARVLHEAGYELVEEPSRRHPPKVRRFERAKANQLWQTDLFTFVLKRQNRRVYLVGFLDDSSRFVVSYGLHASQSTALVLEVLEAGIACYGPPEEILTDNGPQYVTWRGKSRFTRALEKRGIRQIVARPKRPQTLGKIERFWGTMWREFLEGAVFVDLDDARVRIGHFIDYYNFQRPHRGIDGLVPADRFFGAGSDVLRTLQERVAANALELARHGKPKAPFYVTGQVDGQSFSVHAEGQRLILRRSGQEREEIELAGPAADRGDATTSSTNDSVCHDPAEQAGSGLPRPCCPDGSPRSAEGEPGGARPPAPGESTWDEDALAKEGLLPEEYPGHEDLEQADDATGAAGGDPT